MVNLFIPSRLDWKDGGMTVTQTTDFPDAPSTCLYLAMEKPSKKEIRIRKPGWSKGMNVKVNGKKVSAKAGKDGYVALDRTWKNGDRIDVDFDMELTFEPAPDGSGKGAVFYGPIVMAARLGTEGMQDPAPYSDPKLYNDYYTYDYHIPAGLPEKIDLTGISRTGPLSFRTHDGLTLEPLYDIHGERYGVYWYRTKD